MGRHLRIYFEFCFEAFSILWMHKPSRVAALPLLKGKTEIIERCLIRIKPRAIGSQDSNLLRCEIQDLSELHFALPDLFFRLLALTTLCMQRLVGSLEIFNRSFRSSRARVSDSLALLCATLTNAIRMFERKTMKIAGISLRVGTSECQKSMRNARVESTDASKPGPTPPTHTLNMTAKRYSVPG